MLQSLGDGLGLDHSFCYWICRKMGVSFCCCCCDACFALLSTRWECERMWENVRWWYGKWVQSECEMMIMKWVQSECEMMIMKSVQSEWEIMITEMGAIKMWDDDKEMGCNQNVRWWWGKWVAIMAAARNNVDPILILQTGKRTDRQTGFVWCFLCIDQNLQRENLSLLQQVTMKNLLLLPEMKCMCLFSWTLTS